MRCASMSHGARLGGHELRRGRGGRSGEHELRGARKRASKPATGGSTAGELEHPQ